MALYTPLTPEDLALVDAAYGLGGILLAVGIPQGSINTNYRLETGKGRRFLRHTTVRSEEDLRFEARLLSLLHDGAFGAPRLDATLAGLPFLPLKGGRVSVFHFLPGDELQRADLSPEHLERLGKQVGKLHRLSAPLSGDRPNPYGPATVSGWLEGLTGNAELKETAVELQVALEESLRGPSLLPEGAIHSDIFLDNVKWVGSQVSAIFDFEMACLAPYVLDVAITLNAWCFEDGYRWPLAQSLLRGYEEERVLNALERQGLYFAALFGAVRYTTSRIRDFHLSKLPADRLFKKDYRTYLHRTRALRALGPTAFAERAGLLNP